MPAHVHFWFRTGW